MVGSACFALASLPGASSLSANLVGVTYFTGSIFFTAAALGQLGTSRGHGRLDLSASAIQFAGTLLFNLSTFSAMSDELSAQQAHRLVWAPDAFGSVCFWPPAPWRWRPSGATRSSPPPGGSPAST